MSGREAPLANGTAPVRGFDDFELRLGDIMRGERATLGKSLIDVQRELKIKATYIAAIENADPAAFDTPGFIAGYVRSYARYLGLDPEWAWQRFCEEARFEVPHGLSAAASAPRQPRRTGVVRDALSDPAVPFVPRGPGLGAQVEPRAVGSLLILAALIAAVGYGAWSVLQEVQRVSLAPVDQAPGIVADLAALPPSGGPALPAAPAAEAGAGLAARAAESLARLYRPPALDVPVLVARDGPISAVPPGSLGALAGEGAVTAGREGAAAADKAARDAPQVLAPDAAEVVLVAVRPAWVRVTAANGTVLLEKILEPGERWAVPSMEEPPRLRSGNSGAVYFVVGGQTYGPAAPGAQVVRNIALDAASLTEGFALADIAKDPDLAAVLVADAAATAGSPASE
jgi:hypothetical protein